jgi:mRNA interferase MazF
MLPKPGEVWLADLGIAAKTRPVIIVSRFDEDPPRQIFIYVPLTTQNRQSSYEVTIPQLPFLREISVANVQGIASLPTARLERKLGSISFATLQEIQRAILFALNISPALWEKR